MRKLKTQLKKQTTKRKRGKRRTRKVQRGGSPFPTIVQHAFWGVADSVRDSYNALAGNYPGVSSSVLVQGPTKGI